MKPRNMLLLIISTTRLALILTLLVSRPALSFEEHLLTEEILLDNIDRVVELSKEIKDKKVISYKDIFHPVIAHKGMVVSQSVIASEVGAEILRRGGNAVDAAVGVGFALSVVLPRAGNLGGGGFMLVHLSKTKQTIAIDYRETAPENAYRDLFLNENNEVNHDMALETLASAGVPGTVSGLYYALKNYGTMSWKEVIEPARSIASEGILITHDIERLIGKSAKYLRLNKETCRVYFKEGCQSYTTGEVLKLPDLANTLAYLQEAGADGFYRGDIAKKIVKAMEQSNGIITASDLANYKVKEVLPVKGTFNGYEIFTMPPPSSGGVHLIQMFNMLESLPITDLKPGSAALYHYMAEIFKRAYADRSEYLGDPNFINVPVEGLISKAYAAALTKTISADEVTPSTAIKAGKPMKYESPDTTHFSVVDSQGNAVSNTYTLNHNYGSGIIIKGTGFFINNTMDDFSAKAGSPNSYGLIGGKANEIQPNKRPLSSMTPTIVLKDGKPFLITGTPGGSKIITSVFQLLVNVLWFDMNVLQATNMPRVHHQWLPDVLSVERGIANDTIDILQQKGYQIEQSNSLGSLQSIMIKNGLLFGAADPRRPGAAAIGVD